MTPDLPLADRIAIVDADFGRDFGWHVLNDSNEPLATLTKPVAADMFWTSYRVTPVVGHDITATEDFWHPGCHRLRNIAYPSCIVDTFGHFNVANTRVTLRSTYINVKFCWADRLHAPWWFLRRWL